MAGHPLLGNAGLEWSDNRTHEEFNEGKAKDRREEEVGDKDNQ